MKKRKNKKILDKNQQSFFFEDYLSTNQKLRKEKDYIINEDRIYILFFSFFFIILIFSLKIMFVSFQSSNLHINKNYQYNFNPVRNDIIDRNGVLLSRNITAYHAAIKPSFIKDKKKFLVKVKLVLPEIDSKNLILNLNNKKYFYLKKRLTDIEKDKLWKLGEKGIIFEPFQTRVYPHSNLYSHIIGQTDYDNYGISGVENYYDNYLRDKKKFDKPLQLTLDTNIQYLIKKELEDAIKIFEAEGAASLLMDSKNGEVLSLVSLPDYNINKRINLRDKERQEITLKLLEFHNQKLMFDQNSFSVSPGNLLKFNYLFDTFNINLNNDFLDNLKILIMEHKKEKNIFYLELIRFYVDYYLDIQKNKKYFTLEKFVEKRSFLFKNIYNYFYYNLNQNTLLNNINHQFKNE